MSNILDTTIKSIVLIALLIVGFKLAVTGNPPQMNEKVKQLPAFDTKDSDETDDHKLNPLVRLEDDKGEFFCSGTVISNKYVLTAAYCLADAKGHLNSKTIHITSIKPDGGEVVTVDAIAASRNSRADYGLVTGDFSAFNKMKIMVDPRLSPTVAGVAGPVVACGFPWGSTNVCYQLTGEAIPYYEGIAVDGTLYPGMSGGPVVDIGRGELVIAINSAVGEGHIVIMPLIGLFETLGVKVNDNN